MTEILTIILTGVGAVFSVIGVVYTFFRNLKFDFDSKFDHLFRRMDESDKRWMDSNRRLDETNRRLDDSSRRLDDVYHILLTKIDGKAKA